MKRILSLILLLAAMPAAAQWNLNLNYGWLSNVSPDWAENGYDDQPFSLWGSGWQAGGGMEYRLKDWLAWGGSAAYQNFAAWPSGRSETAIDGHYLVWSGESSWQAPAGLYIRLIRPRAILGTNLKLGLGMMASHIGLLNTGITINEDTDFAIMSPMPGTGETVYRPFGQISAGIKIPVTARFGITVDYGYLSTFDRAVAEIPLEMGLEIGW